MKLHTIGPAQAMGGTLTERQVAPRTAPHATCTRGQSSIPSRSARSWRGGPATAAVQPTAAASGPVPTARTSLIQETMRDMEQDTELQQALTALAQVGQQELTREEKLRRQRSLDSLGVPSFSTTCKALRFSAKWRAAFDSGATPHHLDNLAPRRPAMNGQEIASPLPYVVQERGVAPLVRSPARIFQVNIGLYCNQACTHCHVESSPKRTEMMDRATLDKCLDVIRASPSITAVDITGGAPELHQHFRYFAAQASALGLEVIDRCNLTVLLEPGQEDLPEFLAQHKVRVVASLPCYSQSNVDQQRGRGVFERSIEGLKLLNAVGYGREGSGLALDLVYNPGGAFLAGDQEKLQVAYKSELGQAYGITFNSLLALNNMPIKRFADFLVRRNKLDDYMKLLLDNFNPASGKGLMCRDTVSVRWDGRLYDCDFNQQLDLPMKHRAAGHEAPSIFDVSSVAELTGWAIAVDNHCFGCTAGSGSSCQGSTTS